MNIHKISLGVLICLISVNLFAQSDINAPAKINKYAIYVGVGPNIYINNLVLGKDYVNSFNYSIAARFMWEPEHLLSLGIETGYYRLYSITIPELPDVKISNGAVPIHLVICMKFLKDFYFSFSSGQTILYNNVSTPKNGNLDATTLSLGDFSSSIGYKRHLNNRISLGSEVKFFYASKLDDKNFALLFMCGFHF